MSTTTTITNEPITAQSILRLFPDIDTSSAELDGHDAEQIRLMDEVCIVLDENDKPIGNFSKKICECPRNYNSRNSLTKCWRPSYDQYRQGLATPRILCLPI